MTDNDKREIEEIVKRIVAEYGETLGLLGKDGDVRAKLCRELLVAIPEITGDKQQRRLGWNFSRGWNSGRDSIERKIKELGIEI